jgi:acetyl-CoA synthetase
VLPTLAAARLNSASGTARTRSCGDPSPPGAPSFGPEALEYRLQNSDAVVAICDENSFAAMQEVRDKCPAPRQVIGVGKIGEEAHVRST